MSGHHHVTPANYNRLFALGVLINLVYVLVEAGYGLAADSLALLADAGHNLSDVFSLLLAWGAVWLAARPSTPRRSYGYRRITILAALISAVLLLIAIAVIAWEAVGRFSHPRAPDAGVVMVVAAIGVLINGGTALLFLQDRRHDLNIRAAYLHMAADAAVSVGVVVAGAAMLLTGWYWLDPLISLLVVLAILKVTWDLLLSSVNLLIDAAPPNIEPNEVASFLLDLPGVCSLHDLHIWSVSTTETVLTVHLVMPEPPGDDAFLRGLASQLFQQFAIGHSTVQIERYEVAGSCQKTACR